MLSSSPLHAPSPSFCYFLVICFVSFHFHFVLFAWFVGFAGFFGGSIRRWFSIFASCAWAGKSNYFSAFSCHKVDHRQGRITMQLPMTTAPLPPFSLLPWVTSMHFWQLVKSAMPFPLFQLAEKKYAAHFYCLLSCVCVRVCVYYLMSRIHTSSPLIFPLMRILSCIMLTFWRANKHNLLIKYFLLPAPLSHSYLAHLWQVNSTHTHTGTHIATCIYIFYIFLFANLTGKMSSAHLQIASSET